MGKTAEQCFYSVWRYSRWCAGKAILVLFGCHIGIDWFMAVIGWKVCLKGFQVCSRVCEARVGSVSAVRFSLITVARMLQA